MIFEFINAAFPWFIMALVTAFVAAYGDFEKEEN